MHVIQHLRIEAKAPDQPSARRLQDDLSRWCRSEAFWERVSDRLNELVPVDRVLRIERIEMDIHATDEETFWETVLEQLTQEIMHSVSGTTISRTDYVRKLALFFLTYGYMPAGTADADVLCARAFLEDLATAPDLPFTEMFRDHIPGKRQLVVRLVQHLGRRRARKALLLMLAGVRDMASPLEWMSRFLEKEQVISQKSHRNPTVFEMDFWQYLLQEKAPRIFTNEIECIETLHRLVKGFDASETETTSDRKAETPDNLAVFYIRNAGIVLLAPFFPQLFRALNWIENNAWKSEYEAHLAVRLTGYICSGTDEDWEYNWVLAKILCGLTPETVIDQEQPLSEEALQLSVQMTEAAIDQWKVLKSTTPAGLRDMFLIRDGKLGRDEEGTGWRLQVEKKAQDVLLERIPWGISVIRLPWMQDMLFVEW